MNQKKNDSERKRESDGKKSLGDIGNVHGALVWDRRTTFIVFCDFSFVLSVNKEKKNNEKWQKRWELKEWNKYIVCDRLLHSNLFFSKSKCSRIGVFVLSEKILCSILLFFLLHSLHQFTIFFSSSVCYIYLFSFYLDLHKFSCFWHTISIESFLFCSPLTSHTIAQMYD